MTYDKKIRIEKLSAENDVIGNQIETWETVLNTWANVKSGGGKEYYAAAQTNSQNDMIFRIRYSKIVDDLPFKTAVYRIIYQNRAFNIKHAENYLEKNQEFVIRAEVIS